MSLWADDQWWKEMHAPRHPAPPVSESETADCATCKIPDPMMPSHNPSPYCESGKRPHCTCDRCY